MDPLEQEILQKKVMLQEASSAIRTHTVHLKDELDLDSRRLKKVAVAYEHSGGLLKRTNEALDRMLA